MRVTKAYDGLSQEQRMKVKAALMQHGVNHNRGSDGWSLYRMPTVANPPTTLRLHYRDSNGKLLQVINITTDGVTR